MWDTLKVLHPVCVPLKTWQHKRNECQVMGEICEKRGFQIACRNHDIVRASFLVLSSAFLAKDLEGNCAFDPLTFFNSLKLLLVL